MRNYHCSSLVGASREMKPLGTITKCFPFLDEEITKNLTSLMQDSLHYSDFLDRVVEQLMNSESSPMMVFFAVVHLYNTSRLRELESILIKYHDLTLIQPYIKFLGLATQETTIDDVLQSAEEIVLTAKNHWVVFEMHCLRFLCAATNSLGSSIEQNALTQLQNLIDSTSGIDCFRPILLRLQASRLHHEGSISEAISYNQESRVQFLSCDDLYGLYETYIALAYSLRNVDTKKAHEMLDKANELMKLLGFDAEKDWGYHNIRASVHNARGEYSLSMELYDIAIRFRESQRVYQSLRFLPLNVSFLYSELEDGENALEWAKMALESRSFLSDHPTFKAMTLTRMARALVLLGDIEQAEMYLNQSEAESLKAGSESTVAENLVVAGYIETAKGNLANAMYHFERGLEVAEKINYQNRINSCLIGLVKSEIAMLESTDATALLERSGPWMKLLQAETDKKDLPGIQGILILLKTELRLKQGRIDDANELLKEIRSIAKKPGLRYLNDKAHDLQKKCDLLEKEEQGA
jgi:tetratricopeptide (TPR) repeat protein